MNKSILQAVVEAAFMALVVIFLLSAIKMIVETTGAVYGTEFGMLIRLVNVGNKILALLCLRVLLRWVFPEPMSFKEIFQLSKSIRIRTESKSNENA